MIDEGVINHAPTLRSDGHGGPPLQTMPESFAQKRSRAGKILAALKKSYPDAKCALNFTNPLELLIATILSAQCTDKRVNIVTKDLFKKYRAAKDYAAADVKTFEQEIHSTGFYKNKTRNIINCCKKLAEKHGGKVPNQMEDLVELPGVGRKTANVILGNAYGIPGVTVDTHVRRLSNRMGLTTNDDPDKIEQDLMKLFPEKEWTWLSHALIHHGRGYCTARRPECPKCPIEPFCPKIGA